MVSIKTVLTLGAIGVGVVLFFGAGGFKGVGQKIGSFVGGGLADFSSSITSSLTGGLFGGAVNTSTGGESADTSTGTIGPPPRTGTEEFDPFGNLAGNLKGLQNILDSINNAVGGLFGGQGAAAVGPNTVFFPAGQSLSTLSSGQRSSLAFAQRTSLGPFAVQPRQGSAVSRTGQRVVVNLGGRQRTFGSQASAASFIERFNR